MAFRLNAAVCGVAIALSLANVAKATSEASRFAKATTETDVDRSSDVDAAVARRSVVGGTAPDAVRAQLVAARAILEPAARS